MLGEMFANAEEMNGKRAFVGKSTKLVRSLIPYSIVPPLSRVNTGSIEDINS